MKRIDHAAPIMDHPSSRNREAGFSLIELLVVITIIGVLTSLLLPAVQSAREAARRMACGNNLRQIGIGLHNYHFAIGCFPTGCTQPNGNLIGWTLFLLPYIEQQNVHRLFHFDQSCKSIVNSKATHCVISTYLCPSTAQFGAGRVDAIMTKHRLSGLPDAADGMACGDYGGMYGWSDNEPGNGVLIYDRHPIIPGTKPVIFDHSISLDDVRDGSSSTIIVAEDTGRGWQSNGEWANGQNIFSQTGRINVTRDDEMWSDHPGGVHAAFCDGAAHFLGDAMDKKVIEALCTRNGGEVIGGNEFP